MQAGRGVAGVPDGAGRQGGLLAANRSIAHWDYAVSVARCLGALPWHHRDPFDRMLVAQAQVAGLKMHTADAAASAYGDSVLVAR